jgi:hypothetical protein
MHPLSLAYRRSRITSLCVALILLAGLLPVGPLGSLIAPAQAADPGFAVRRFFGQGKNLMSAAIGDMDGDGDLDIVGGSKPPFFNTIYLNDGLGNFVAGSSFGTAASFTQGVAVGDLNGDGSLDVVAGNCIVPGSFPPYTCTSDAPNALYLNDGAGNFSASRSFGTGSDKTTSVALGDMDRDGDLDIVVGNEQQQSAAYLNDGAGNFAVEVPFGPASGPGPTHVEGVVLGALDAVTPS